MRKTKTLLGISLFGVLLLSLGVILTKSRITQAQQSFTRTNIMYTGIDSNAETLYALRFQDLTTMEIFNNNIFRTSEVPVIVNGVNLSNQSEIDTSRNTINSSNNSNILGGDLLKIEGSDDITVIGGEGNPEEVSVHPNNSYATFLGGLANKLFENGEIQVPVVLLGGEKNIMRPNHNASVIVGGVDNQIHDNAKNVSILGGENNTVEGDRSNIIIGGENVRIHEVDDVFVFSDGSDGEFSPNMGGAFYLNVQNGVGFGTGASGSGGVVSNGAVSIGGNIDDIECNEENIGIQGKWNGCLVGCTQAAASVTDWDTWELLDHGPSCADKCESSNKCMQLEEKEPEEIESYTSFCTQGLVFTGNASMCNTGGVDDYENVVFETYLIDSTATCPSDDDYYNQCAYKCDPDTHLTGDDTGKFNKITMCFHDCRLPWDDEGTLPRKRHNETIFAYDATDAYCSNDAGVKDHCGTHKKELICVDGRWYTTNNSHKAAAENRKYVYETCTLNRYEGCDGTGYDLTRREIINEKEDFMPFWRYGGGNQHFINYLGYLNGAAYVSYQYVDNLYDQFHGWALDDPKQADRSQQQGVRGVYKLCIDYVPDTSTGDPTNVDPDNAKTCREKDPLPKQYHYKFIRCRNDPNNVYDEDSFGVCRKRCTFGTKTIKHTETISLYTGSSATCTDICHAEIFRCYDGTLYQDSTLQIDAKGKLISGVPHHNASMSIYNQLNCTLNGVTCPGYSTTQSTYNANQNSGYYTSCQKYSASGKFNCTAGDMMYQLQWCNADHYQNSDACPSCPAGYHTSGTGATAKSQCVINCPAGTHVATADQQCVSCPTGTQSSAHSVNGGSTSNCTTCNNKPPHSHYVSNGSQNNCNWECDANYYQNGNSCEACPTGYNSNTGSTSINQCKITCSAANYVATQGAQCSACSVGKYSYGDTKYYPNTGTCGDCVNGPENSEYTTSGVTPYNCQWQCSAGYYKDTEIHYYPVCPAGEGQTCTFKPGVGNVCKYDPNGICQQMPVSEDVCTACPEGYTSDAGATSSSQCYLEAQCGSADPSTWEGNLRSDRWPYGFSVAPGYSSLCSIGIPDTPQALLGIWTWSCTNYNSMVRCSAPYKASCTQQGCGTVNHGETLTCFAPTTCPDTECESVARKCNDGSWYLVSIRPTTQSDFPTGSSSSCKKTGTNGNCDSTYDKTSIPSHANYDTCDYYQGGDSCTLKHKYKITSCKEEDGYHLCEGSCKSNASCGSAANTSHSSKPSSDLCGAGSHIEGSVTGSGPWNWTCARNCDTISCSASKSSSSNGNQGNQGNQGTCFLAGTHVLTKDGYKNIEDILTGDLVLSYNTLANEYEYNKVLKKIVHENSIDDVYTLTIDGNKLDVTELHPFYVIGEAGWPYQCHLPYEWVSANRLRVGDKLLMSDGSYATIENITHRSNRSTTYNLNVENAHTYFVGEGYLVHNSDLTKDQQNRWESAGGNESRAWYANDCDLHPENCEGRIDRWTGVY